MSNRVSAYDSRFQPITTESEPVTESADAPPSRTPSAAIVAARQIMAGKPDCAPKDISVLEYQSLLPILIAMRLNDMGMSGMKGYSVQTATVGGVGSVPVSVTMVKTIAYDIDDNVMLVICDQFPCTDRVVVN